MARKIFLVVLILIVGYFAYGEIKDFAVDYYVEHYYVRNTLTPATKTPDQVALTWSGDPATTQAINWRTAPSVTEGWVEYRPAAETDADAELVEANFRAVEDHLLENDTINHRFTAELGGLTPRTRYAY
ncbi:MAG: fibronectin type III domain-containing protein, partial [Candidatus Hydrogenedentales bacterium]